VEPEIASRELTVAAHRVERTIFEVRRYRTKRVHTRVAARNGVSLCACSASGGAGTVFKLDAGGASSSLYTFGTGADTDSLPLSPLAEAPDGNLYRMTSQTVFQITPAGVFSKLLSLTNPTADGAVPFGSLSLASDGSFYGTTSGGGAHSLGVVFKMTLAGSGGSGSGGSSSSSAGGGSTGGSGSTGSASSGSGALCPGLLLVLAALGLIRWTGKPCRPRLSRLLQRQRRTDKDRHGNYAHPRPGDIIQAT